MSILIIIIGLAIVIMVHELGHLLAAKWSGIGVHEFSIGFGPLLLKWQSKETLYSIRAIPLGGFVKLAGMDDEQGTVVPPELDYYRKPLAKRLLVIVSGALMNIVLGILILFMIALLIGIPETSNQIAAIKPLAPAQLAGLLTGDRITRINNHPVDHADKDIIEYIHQRANQPLRIEVTRANSAIMFTIIPTLDPKSGWGLIGIQMGTTYRRYPPLQALLISGRYTWTYATYAVLSVQLLFSGQASLDDVMGPIGIVQVIESEMRKNLFNFFNIIALITINLGVINLFPFPALDGGHVIILLVEKLRGRPLKRSIENAINNVGMILLLSLMGLVIYNDVRNWEPRRELLNGQVQEKSSR